MNFIFSYLEKKKNERIQNELVNNVLPRLQDEIQNAHVLEIKLKEDPDYKIYYFDDLEAMKKIMLDCYKINMDIRVDLNEEIITVEDFIDVINLNPHAGKFENLDNCKTIEEVKDWLEFAWFLEDIKEEALKAL